MKHVVGFSGGIDSQGAARWVLNRYPKEDVILINSDAGGNEDTYTTDFVCEYSKTVHPVVTVHAINSDMWEDGSDRPEHYGLDPNGRLTFDGLIARKGVPNRRHQFCTEILKIKPQRRWLREQFGPSGQYAGMEYERYTGVRRDESDKRANTPSVEWDRYFDCPLNHPLFDWTKQMVFDYVRAHGEKINALYSLGFNRVGCAPCINSGKADILNWEIRRPEMLHKIRQWEATVTLPSKDKPGFTFFGRMIPGKTTNSIDEVIQWAKTSHGGREELLPIMHDRPSCESKYGLCE